MLKKIVAGLSLGFLSAACAASESQAPPIQPKEALCTKEEQAPPAAVSKGLVDPGMAPDFGAPGPIESTFKRLYPKGLQLEHGNTACTVGSSRPYPETISAIGWSADSASFGFCAIEDGSGAFVCELATTDGKVTREDDLTNHEPDEKKTQALYQKVVERRYGEAAKEWPYTDLSIVYEAKRDTSDPEHPTVLLRVGARYKTEQNPVYVLTFRADFDNPKLIPDEIALSPDGKYLGVVANFQSKIIPVHELASRVYNTTAYRHHQKGELEFSARLFHKAAYADPSSKVAMYNLACALARLEDPGAQAALSLAIQQHGDIIKEKARRDKDFDGVREESWFQALVF